VDKVGQLAVLAAAVDDDALDELDAEVEEDDESEVLVDSVLAGAAAVLELFESRLSVR